MNSIHHANVHHIILFPCFTGSLEAGQAAERIHLPGRSVDLGATHSVATQQIDEGEDSEDGKDGSALNAAEDDWAGEQLDALNTFMLNLSLVD